MTTPSVDAIDYLRDAMNSTQVSALVTQNPDGTLAVSADIGPGPKQITIQPLQGPEGAAGAAQFPLTPMPDVFTTPDALPWTTLGVADTGKFWIIAQTDSSGDVMSVAAYIWYGNQFRWLPFGSQGPEGPYPWITPSVELLGPDETSVFDVTGGTGTAASPYTGVVELSVPAGPQGPSCPLAQFTDVDETTVAPLPGQFLAYTGSKWTPQSVGVIPLMPYTVPQSLFTHQAGIIWGSANATICQFEAPAQEWAWFPAVFGKIRLFEASLTLQPNMLGISVTLGSAMGPLVARGFGNTLSGVVDILPHTSTPGSPSTAMTPSGGVGLVAAGNPITLFVNVVNDGLPFKLPLWPGLQAALDALAAALADTVQGAAAWVALFGGTITTDIQTALDNVANVLGNTGVGHAIADVVGFVLGIGGTVSGVVHAAVKKLVTAINVGVNTAVEDLVSVMSSFTQTVTSDIQTAIDTVAGLLGLSGTGHTLAQITLALTLYTYNPSEAQLFVMACPQTIGD